MFRPAFACLAQREETPFPDSEAGNLFCVQECDRCICLQRQIGLGLNAFSDPCDDRTSCMYGEAFAGILEEGSCTRLDETDLVGIKGVSKFFHHFLTLGQPLATFMVTSVSSSSDAVAVTRVENLQIPGSILTLVI